MEKAIAKINNSICSLISHLDVKAYGMAESVAIRGEEEKTFPALILDNGECINVYAETDEHDITLYHRLNSISYQENENAARGDSRGYTSVASMSVVFFGKRKAINQYKLEQIANAAITKDNTNVISGSEFNALQVFASEYMGTTFFIDPEYYLFRINYSITSILNPRCIKPNTL
jgi:hypothetical protein